MKRHVEHRNQDNAKKLKYTHEQTPLLDVILAALKNLDAPSLAIVIDAAKDLYYQKSPALPPEIWRYIFSQTSLSSPGTDYAMAPSTGFYQSLQTLFSLQAVSRSWKEMITEVLETIQTNFVSHPPRTHIKDFPIMKKTVYFAIIFGNTRILEYCLRCCAGRISYCFSSTQFHLVCCFGSYAATKTLTDCGFYPSRTLNPLQQACDTGNTKLVSLLLNDHNVTPEDGEDMALRIASFEGHTEVVKLLLADPRVGNGPGAVDSLAQASEWNCVDVVKILLADPRFDPSADGDKAFISAARGGHASVVELLLADPRTCTKADILDLFLRSTYGQPQITQVFLKDPRFIPTPGLLSFAVSKGHLESLKLLLEDPRLSKNTEGYKYLLVDALHHQQSKVLKFLLQQPWIDLCMHNDYILRTALTMDNTDDVQSILKDLEVSHGRKFSPKELSTLKTDNGMRLQIKEGETSLVFDSFGVDEEGLTDKEVVEIWGRAFGRTPISWEVQTEGCRKHVCYLPNRDSPLCSVVQEETYWSCKGNNGKVFPIVFSLVCGGERTEPEK